MSHLVQVLSAPATEALTDNVDDDEDDDTDVVSSATSAIAKSIVITNKIEQIPIQVPKNDPLDRAIQAKRW